MSNDRIIRFSQEDLDLFSRVSGDTNPLHLSPAYASRTAYGQQVVFGALGCLACLGALDPSWASIDTVAADFHRPMFLDVNYRLEMAVAENRVTVRLMDGTAPVVTAAIVLGSGERTPQNLGGEASFPLHEARAIAWDDLQVGHTVVGTYALASDTLKKIRDRWSIQVAEDVVTAVLWSSYFIGMELPGRSALFFRLVLTFRNAARRSGLLNFEGKIAALNRSLGQMRVNVELRCGENAIASGQLTSFIRPTLSPLQIAADPFSDQSDELVGKTAVVVGASRGLGAAITVALARRGVDVIAIARSEPDWLVALPALIRRRIDFKQGDGAKSDSLAPWAEETDTSHSGLDFLVCSAFPAIPALRLEPNGTERIRDYISRSTELVLAPLCTFLPLLRRRGGCTILISSGVVAKPVRDWPHYVAAKRAAEALCEVAAMQYPETGVLIVRPEKLLTEMTNTPMGRNGAADPNVLADDICFQLVRPPQPGTVRVFGSSAVTDAPMKSTVREEVLR